MIAEWLDEDDLEALANYPWVDSSSVQPLGLCLGVPVLNPLRHASLLSAMVLLALVLYITKSLACWVGAGFGVGTETLDSALTSVDAVELAISLLMSGELSLIVDGFRLPPQGVESEFVSFTTTTTTTTTTTSTSTAAPTTTTAEDEPLSTTMQATTAAPSTTEDEDTPDASTASLVCVCVCGTGTYESVW